MIDGPYIAEVAALFGNPARANILCALKDQGSLSATELVLCAGVAANTTSEHLAKLERSGLIVAERNGRFRYYRLACHEIVDVIEALEVLSVKTVSRYRPANRDSEKLKMARSCYDHLAGRLGVRLANACRDLGFVVQTQEGLGLTESGEDLLAALGIDIDQVRSRRRDLLRDCSDWSEGTAHLGGALGAELFRSFLKRGWLTKPKNSRVVMLTREGKAAFRKYFSLES